MEDHLTCNKVLPPLLTIRLLLARNAARSHESSSNCLQRRCRTLPHGISDEPARRAGKLPSVSPTRDCAVRMSASGLKQKPLSLQGLQRQMEVYSPKLLHLRESSCCGHHDRQTPTPVFGAMAKFELGRPRPGDQMLHLGGCMAIATRAGTLIGQAFLAARHDRRGQPALCKQSPVPLDSN